MEIVFLSTSNMGIMIRKTLYLSLSRSSHSQDPHRERERERERERLSLPTSMMGKVFSTCGREKFEWLVDGR